MACPKRKTSKSRKNKRRSHLAQKSINLIECPRCHEFKLPHHVCPSCGYYNGEKIIQDIEKSTAETKS
ncbi:MAG: 50S ribosomal protein L32 [Candidatus Caldatribacteriota bacterium]|nr:50S ribosomal protein L32 [Atribacterota bacterium]MDD3031021.1 50S ribosomal protein L32 [Atribacterota bacterium]MDD3640190.1 50S ribosomal protein L32 [Atribacterota bacterium]MDD4288536.1 50S ribosomal protein L32 [Atribacterota bacterium]MDD4765245.1 50S ribosomal protein L32 [Atribacterota bacterium]